MRRIGALSVFHLHLGRAPSYVLKLIEHNKNFPCMHYLVVGVKFHSYQVYQRPISIDTSRNNQSCCNVQGIKFADEFRELYVRNYMYRIDNYGIKYIGG